MTLPAQEKAALRARLRAARAALGDEARRAASAAIARRLAELPELAAARSVLGYAAGPAEVDLDPWLRARLARGDAVWLPWVDGPALRLGAVTDLGALVAGWRGLREPPHDPTDPGGDPAVVDAAVVPGLGWDAAGGRLGQGGGHVDRLLARLRPGVPVVGVAFAVQVVGPPGVPREPHDVPVDVVVTEDAVLRARWGRVGGPQ
jgi:5-formyltetrahydrofolate cyclo-ligase